MNREQMKVILDKIKAYEKIIIFRHKRPDGDAVGSTKGLCEILKLTYPEKQIYIINNDYSDFTGFLGGEDEARPDEFYADALGIVIDTATIDRVSNPKCALCKELVKIDHHIDRTPYGDVSWVEEEKSSACEMIADFYAAFSDELKINSAAATYIYAGMVTDSGRFRFRSVTGDTLRAAAMLLDQGIDTDTLFANLYMKEFHTLKFQAHVYKKMKISPAGVVYLYIDRAMQKKFKLTSEQASASISYLESIKDSLIWLVCIENGDGTARVRLRSRFVTINELAERYNGGGHACACGATVHNKKEFKALVNDADALLQDYKANHEGWL
ncbi:MAG: bifunctional oligoribonuclease/PAP phosphatase NrnA [Ruminococcaceae bacterium]|nr:bifunctional oligoribonuclease/PAP phosphatase NrnA [Oscillospiraceae bacterium]